MVPKSKQIVIERCVYIDRYRALHHNNKAIHHNELMINFAYINYIHIYITAIFDLICSWPRMWTDQGSKFMFKFVWTEARGENTWQVSHNVCLYMKRNEETKWKKRKSKKLLRKQTKMRNKWRRSSPIDGIKKSRKLTVTNRAINVIESTNIPLG